MTSTPIKTQSFLANLPLFKQMDAAELDRVAAGAREIRVARGEVLFRKGDTCEGFHLIVFGQIKLAFASPSGAEKVVEIMGPGHSFGEAVMFTGRPYPVYAQALADSMLLHVAKSIMFDEIDRDPALARKMIGGLVFLEHYLTGFVAQHPEYDAAKLADIVRKTARKMSPYGRAAVPRLVRLPGPLAPVVLREVAATGEKDV